MALPISIPKWNTESHNICSFRNCWRHQRCRQTFAYLEAEWLGAIGLIIVLQIGSEKCWEWLVQWTTPLTPLIRPLCKPRLNWLKYQIIDSFSVTYQKHITIIVLQIGSEKCLERLVQWTTPLTPLIRPLCKPRLNWLKYQIIDSFSVTYQKHITIIVLQIGSEKCLERLVQWTTPLTPLIRPLCKSRLNWLKYQIIDSFSVIYQKHITIVVLQIGSEKCLERLVQWTTPLTPLIRPLCKPRLYWLKYQIIDSFSVTYQKHITIIVLQIGSEKCLERLVQWTTPLTP